MWHTVPSFVWPHSQISCQWVSFATSTSDMLADTHSAYQRDRDANVNHLQLHCQFLNDTYTEFIPDCEKFWTTSSILDSKHSGNVLTEEELKLLLVRHKKKGKAVPLQARRGPEGSRKLRLPDFVQTPQDGGKVVSLTHRPPLPPGNTPGTHFC